MQTNMNSYEVWVSKLVGEGILQTHAPHIINLTTSELIKLMSNNYPNLGSPTPIMAAKSATVIHLDKEMFCVVPEFIHDDKKLMNLG